MTTAQENPDGLQAAPADEPWMAVGYDGSEPAKTALHWAADYAAVAMIKVRLIHAWIWPLYTRELGPVHGVEGSGLRQAAQDILDEGVAMIRETAGDVTIESDLKPGLPADVLRDESRGAKLLVVGNRGIGGILGQLIGSVCLDLAGTSKSPIMVARYPHTHGRQLVACIEGEPGITTVVDAATDLAKVLGSSLRIVHAVPPWRRHHHESPIQGREILQRAVARARQLVPELDVESALLDGHGVAKDLLAEGEGAEALVLGGHRPDGSTGAVATSVLKHAPCNVMIAR